MRHVFFVSHSKLRVSKCIQHKLSKRVEILLFPILPCALPLPDIYALFRHDILTIFKALALFFVDVLYWFINVVIMPCSQHGGLPAVKERSPLHAAQVHHLGTGLHPCLLIKTLRRHPLREYYPRVRPMVRQLVDYGPVLLVSSVVGSTFEPQGCLLKMAHMLSGTGLTSVLGIHWAASWEEQFV